MARYSEGVFSLPFLPSEDIRRVNASTHKKFGYPFALDWYMPEGTPILCPLEGRVIRKESRFSKSGESEMINKCNLLILKHKNEFSVYAHFKFRGLILQIGEKVETGQLMGFSGQTGFATYPHLHFDVWDRDWKNIRVNFSKNIDRCFIDRHFSYFPYATSK